MARTLLATFTALPGRADEVERLVHDYRARVRQEPGNLAFDVYLDEAGPGRFVIHEVYADEAAFQRHLAAPYGPPFNAALGPLVDGGRSALTLLQPLAVG